MTRQWIKAGLLVSIAPVLGIHAAEDERGQLGATSTGYINLSLEITENITAGFLQTNLDDGDSEFRSLLSSRLVQSLRNGFDATLPLCIMSRGEGYFEVTSYEISGAGESRLYSGTGYSVPVNISFGEEETGSLKYQATDEECNENTAIPVTIGLSRPLTGQEVGRIHGRFNLLVKSE